MIMFLFLLKFISACVHKLCHLNLLFKDKQREK